MTDYSHEWFGQNGPSLLVPADFIPVGEAAVQGIDRKLGYLGDRRFVLFYYEAQGQEVIWRDGLSFGFATGGWRDFTRNIWPLSDVYEVCVGDAEGHGGYVLIIDRILGLAYFAPRTSADDFIDGHRQ